MYPATAQQYKANALFRVLAFLDNTGTQSFVLDTEVDADGAFRDAERVFAEDTAISAILAAALDALRANVRRLFTDAAEQHAVLTVLGAGGDSPAPSASPCIADAAAAPLPPSDGATESLDGDAHALSSQALSLSSLTSPQPTPANTAWSEAVRHPVSLANYADDVENEIPIHLLVRLRGVLGIAAPPTDAPEEVARPACCCTSAPFVEQLLVDGLDEWLRRCPTDEVKRMVLACGVQPAVWASAFNPPAQSSEESASGAIALPDAVADFVVDVVFPVPPAVAPGDAMAGAAAAGADGMQDWLLLSYEKNREAFDIEDAEDDSDSDSEGPAALATKRARSSGGDREKNGDGGGRGDGGADGLGAWQPPEGEEVLTAENIDRYMRECPQRVPKEVLREKRKPLADATITEFELEHHYTAAELKKLVKDEVGSMSAAEASAFLDTPVSEDQVQQAATLTRKAQFVKWMLDLHNSPA